jgi:serine/threonine protein kinase/Tol biopolymer transport system component
MIGKEILHFQILEELGRGGMGVVYKARDTRLDRLVAVKCLPTHLAASPQDKSRFIQEAKAASALNHPNVCTIHDIQEHDGQLFLVMEFVDGQTLREKKASTSLKQAVDIGMQVADGLAAAHEKGIVHRDIKPENIMVRKDGIVQIMDFGLAKLRGVSRLTKEGSAVGTAGYMSPEQVQGQEADHRSDIFSLGVVLYELFTGELPFRGVHETAVNYEIVNVDPQPMLAVKPGLDPALDAIVLECLAKEPSERYQSVAEVAKELRRFKRESTRQRVSRSVIAPVYPLDPQKPHVAPPEDASTALPASARPWPWKGIALIVFVLAGALVTFLLLRPEAPAVSLHVELLPPPATSYSVANGGGQFALSPDGRSLAFAAVDTGGNTLLWIRSLKSFSSRALPGTEDAQYPFWSPDGKSIAFFTHGKLAKVDIDGGALFTIADAISPRGGTWNSSGVIVFAPDQTKGLYRVAAVGGKPEVLTRLDTTVNELTHRWPVFLPDQDHFLFFARGSLAGFGGTEKDHLYLGSLSQGTTHQIFSAISDAAFAGGMILYVRENAIVGQAFDPERLTVSGDPVTIAQDIQYTPRWSKGSYSVSQTGMLCYQPGGQEARPDVVLLAKDGSLVQRLGRLDLMFRSSLSPDGKRLAMDILDGQSRNIDVWIYDIDRGMKTRLTFSKQADIAPIWSPDGESVAYTTGMGSETQIVTQSVSGSGQEKIIVRIAVDAFPSDWSSDNKYLLYFTRGDADIWVAPLAGGSPPVKLVGSEYSEAGGKFSPDVRWIAYQSDESGKNEIYVRSFVPPGTSADGASTVKRQISADGGTSPHWRKDGKGVFFVTPRGIMLAELKLEGQSLEVVRVTPFSPVHLPYWGDILPTGDLVASQSPPVASAVVPIHLVVNWQSDLVKQP